MAFILEISGDYACFTRPELRVERVSYPVITPSAARNILSAIFWKPSIKWLIYKIEILKPIQWAHIRRNEVGSKMSKNSPIYIDEMKHRQQRASMLLRDVAYRIHANFELTDKAGKDENYGKFAAMFERRASKGQCFYQPYLGCREFSCSFRLLKSVDEGLPVADINQDFGLVLYDMDYPDENSDAVLATPSFYWCKAENGVIMVPPPHSDEVKR